jgi:hypothetical protein
MTKTSLTVLAARPRQRRGQSELGTEQEKPTMTLAPWKLIVACLAVLAAEPATAQNAAERVAAHTDWSVFVAGNPKECYIVSPPSKSTATRDGQPVEVNRGDIRLFVTFRPGEGVTNEVSFTGGYPFRDESAVKIEVGTESFQLGIGSGDANGWAWPETPAEDQELVSAMRRGATATLTGTSQRGTTTVDTFSLMGFTAAVNDAEARCE